MAHHSITALFYYPIKSLQGIPAPSVTVRRMGIVLDRRWMLVDEDGSFLTQRQHPRLATFSVVHTHDTLLVRTTSGDELQIDIRAEGGAMIPVTIWDSRLDACTVSAECDRFFSDALGLHARLVRIPEAAVRDVDPRYGAKGDHVSFADGYPVLLTCTASLDDLNKRLAEPLPMERFRPNVVVETDVPFEEDGWTALSANGTSFRLVKRCDRCVITTTDQKTGIRSAEPLQTLSTFRKDGNGVFFGMNCIPDAEGVLRIGDHVTMRP